MQRRRLSLGRWRILLLQITVVALGLLAVPFLPNAVAGTAQANGAAPAVAQADCATTTTTIVPVTTTDTTYTTGTIDVTGTTITTGTTETITGTQTVGTDGTTTFISTTTEIITTGTSTFTGTANTTGSTTNTGTTSVVTVVTTTVPCTYTVTVLTEGPGTVAPGGGPYSGTANFAATPEGNALFLGWTVDGTFVGFGNPLSLPVTKDRTVVAAFAPPPTFCDVTPGTLGAPAIEQLAARGVIQGSDNPNGAGKCFRPEDPLFRAHVAGMVTRAFGWQDDDFGNAFTDQGIVDNDLWRNVGTLAYYDVARGYRDGTYDPTGPVLKAQAVSFTTRALLRIGAWSIEEDNAAYYSAVPITSGHRQDLTTYANRAGTVPGTAAPTDPWGGATGYASTSSRAYFAEVLWQAYSSYYSTNHIP